MYKNIKVCLAAVVLLFTTVSLVSCNKDSEEFTTPVNSTINRVPLPPHSLTITNNSRYRYEIFALGAQSSYDLNDPVDIWYKAGRPLIIMPGHSVTYYDYETVSDRDFAIDAYHVIDHSIRQGDLGLVDPDKMAILYGILSQPNNPRSDKYPVWKWVRGAIIDENGTYLNTLSGNVANASLLYIGNTSQGYNCFLNYGRYSGVESVVNSDTATPLATVNWRLPNIGDTSNSGEVKIMIENVRSR